MNVRLSRITGLTIERLEDVVAAFEDSDYVEQLSGLDGFAGYVLARGLAAGGGSNGDVGKIIAMSFWRSSAALEASDDLASSARALRATAARPSRPPLVDRAELVLYRGTTVAPFLRLSRLPGLEPGVGEAVIDAYRRSDYLDQLSELPGFGGYLLIADPERQNMTAVSSWTSRHDLTRSDRLADSARALRADAAQLPADPIVDRYEVVLQRQPQLSAMVDS